MSEFVKRVRANENVDPFFGTPMLMDCGRENTDIPTFFGTRELSEGAIAMRVHEYERVKRSTRYKISKRDADERDRLFHQFKKWSIERIILYDSFAVGPYICKRLFEHPEFDTWWTDENAVSIQDEQRLSGLNSYPIGLLYFLSGVQLKFRHKRAAASRPSSKRPLLNYMMTTSDDIALFHKVNMYREMEEATRYLDNPDFGSFMELRYTNATDEEVNQEVSSSYLLNGVCKRWNECVTFLSGGDTNSPIYRLRYHAEQ